MDILIEWFVCPAALSANIMVFLHVTWSMIWFDSFHSLHAVGFSSRSSVLSWIKVAIVVLSHLFVSCMVSRQLGFVVQPQSCEQFSCPNSIFNTMSCTRNCQNYLISSVYHIEHSVSNPQDYRPLGHGWVVSPQCLYI